MKPIFSILLFMLLFGCGIALGRTLKTEGVSTAYTTTDTDVGAIERRQDQIPYISEQLIQPVFCGAYDGGELPTLYVVEDVLRVNDHEITFSKPINKQTSEQRLNGFEELEALDIPIAYLQVAPLDTQLDANWSKITG